MKLNFGSVCIAFVLSITVAGSADAARLSLEWDAPGGYVPAGYVLHYGTASGAYTKQVDVGATTTYSVDGLLDGKKYYFSVQAYDDTGRKSAMSSEVTGTTGNAPPVVALTNPAHGAVFAPPATMTLSATASDSGGSIRDVAFYANGTLVGPDTSSPYSVSWANVPAGTYVLTAVATDNTGMKTTSSATTVTVSTGTTRVNVALASQGARALASSTFGSGYSASAVTNGDRRGVTWGSGGAWKDNSNSKFPDWMQVGFSGPKTIDEVRVFSLQDNYTSPGTPTTSTTFTKYGLVDFTVQYWTAGAWKTVTGGVVRGNKQVWRTVGFPAVTTSYIRVLVERAQAGYSRIVEIEAYESSGNKPPTVVLTGPAPNAVFTAPATIVVSAAASDTGGSIRKVDFLVNGSAMGSDTTSPHSVIWTGVAAGTYTVTAVATDDDGASTTSSPLKVTVSPGSVKVNVASAAEGGRATASSTFTSAYPASSLINGDRAGVGFGAGGVWKDKTANTFPDWVQLTFSATKTISEVRVFSLQDGYTSPLEPTPTMAFTRYGLVDFTVQYWNGTTWVTVPGAVVRGNKLVWRTVGFAPVTTSAIRLLVEHGQAGYSRITEIEAYAVPPQ